MSTASAGAQRAEDYALDLGGIGYTVVGGSNASGQVQGWFDRGLCQMLGYNHEEAARLFRKAVAMDDAKAASGSASSTAASPTEATARCAMAQWGLACTLIANYNNPDGLDEDGAAEATAAAAEAAAANAAAGCGSAVETGLIAALQARCKQLLVNKPAADAAEPEEEDAKRARYLAATRVYAGALRKVHAAHGAEDSVVTAVFAESLMMLAPWELWTPRADGPIVPAIPETTELMAVLEKALARDPTHPYLCHLYVHVMELSPHPEKALPAADALRVRVPGQGHLLHMASHIDMWVGQYKEAILANANGIAADDAYVNLEGGQRLNFYSFYRFHNMDFRVWAAMFDGQFSEALATARKLSAEMDEEAVKFKLGGELPMGALFLEGMTAGIWHVFVRFGKWQMALDEPLPDAELFPGLRAHAHYAKGIAHAAMGNVEAAEAEQRLFLTAAKNPALKDRVKQNNPVANLDDDPDKVAVLQVAESMLAGEIAYRKRDYDAAFRHLRQAVERDDNLHYDEPAGWMVPTRHALGALLAEQKHFEEARAVFEKDLTIYKENMWALRGLKTCLDGLGLEKEAADVDKRLQVASARAEPPDDDETPANAACYCANGK